MRVESCPKRYIVVDIETTGTNHFKDDIIEIGAVKYDEGIEVDRLSLLLKTEHILSMEIVCLTGITNELLDEVGVEPKVALEALYEFCADDIIIGHNFTSFDSKFIDDAYCKYLGRHFSNDFVDTLYLAKKVFPEMKHRRLEDLSHVFGIDYSRAHRATEDCVINHAVYEYMAFNGLLCQQKENQERTNTINDEGEELELVDDLNDWQKRLKEELNKIIIEKELPPNSLCIMKNKKKGEETVSSYSVCINEPSIISFDINSNSRNDVVVRIEKKSFKKKNDAFEVSPICLPSMETVNIPETADILTKTVQFALDDNRMYEYIKECSLYALDNYKPRQNTFACCSRYESCSLEKKCIHPNKLASLACVYRKNLEEGRVFY